MGVGAEVDAGQPSLTMVPGVGVCYHLDWGWREYIGPGADSWHAATDTDTHITAAQYADLIAAAQQQSGAGPAVAAVLASSRASGPWADAVADATSRGQYAALLAKCVDVYG